MIAENNLVIWCHFIAFQALAACQEPFQGMEKLYFTFRKYRFQFFQEDVVLQCETEGKPPILGFWVSPSQITCKYLSITSTLTLPVLCRFTAVQMNTSSACFAPHRQHTSISSELLRLPQNAHTAYISHPCVDKI